MLGVRDNFVDGVLEDCAGEFVLVGEVPVRRADAEPSAVRDVVETGLQSALGEHLSSGVDE